MKIALASDHGGYDLKEFLIGYLMGIEVECIDLGTKSKESVDYPDFAVKCGEAVVNGQADRGIVCCGTGIGVSIAANKVKGVRCALCTNEEMAKLASEHNNSNVLALGGRIISNMEAATIVQAWLDTKFDGGEGSRHQRRVNKLNNL